MFLLIHCDLRMLLIFPEIPEKNFLLILSFWLIYGPNFDHCIMPLALTNPFAAGFYRPGTIPCHTTNIICGKGNSSNNK